MSSHIHLQAFKGSALSQRNKISQARVHHTELDEAEGGRDICVCFFRRFQAVYKEA